MALLIFFVGEEGMRPDDLHFCCVTGFSYFKNGGCKTFDFRRKISIDAN